MGMLELNDLLPSSQWENNWTFYGAHHEGLLADAEYVVFEYYCDNPGCDCQNLTADIMVLGEDGEPIKKSLALIHYDWSFQETRCEPMLTDASPKTVMALNLLEVYKKFIHHPDYITRIENHYARVKKIVSKEGFKNLTTQKASHNKQVGRNDLCPCGSNKKYKKCCLNTGLSQDM